jgi:hypothetical protein
MDIVTSCALNAALQHRTYDAMLTTTGTLVTVDLTEPRFQAGRGRQGQPFHGPPPRWRREFHTRLLRRRLLVRLPVSEPGRTAHRQHTLVVEGVATTTGTAAGLSGTLNGDFSHWSTWFPSFPQYLDGCYSSNIQFRVTPR